MKEKKRFSKLNIISLIDIIIAIAFIILILRLDILPSKYLGFIIVMIFIINTLAILFINLRKMFFKILGVIISILSILISIIGGYYLYYGVDFLDKSFSNVPDEFTTGFYVVTYKDNNASNKKNIEGKVGYYKDTTNINKAGNYLEKTNKISLTSYEDISPMFKDVSNRIIPYVIIDKTTYDALFNLDTSLNKDDYKIICELKVVIGRNTKKTSVKDRFNLYIGGHDFTGSLMDFNMLITVNTKTNKVLLTSMPRDYYIEEYGTNGRKDTLSYMGANGIEVNQKSLEKLFDTTIDYYMEINTHSLVEVVDSVGGVTFCSDESFRTTHSMILDSYDDSKGKKLYIKEGCQELNGIEALTVARERINVYGGDSKRQQNCKKIFLGIIDKLKSTNTITNYNSILNSFSNLYETTMPREVITNIVRGIINGDDYKISDQAVVGNDGHDFVHLTNLKDWVIYPDMNSVELSKTNIKQILNEN